MESETDLAAAFLSVTPSLQVLLLLGAGPQDLGAVTDQRSLQGQADLNPLPFVCLMCIIYSTFRFLLLAATQHELDIGFFSQHY